jgi:predicted alpha-1,6-mannanase (GH76 family)
LFGGGMKLSLKTKILPYLVIYFALIINAYSSNSYEAKLKKTIVSTDSYTENLVQENKMLREEIREIKLIVETLNEKVRENQTIVEEKTFKYEWNFELIEKRINDFEDKLEQDNNAQMSDLHSTFNSQEARNFIYQVINDVFEEIRAGILDDQSFHNKVCAIIEREIAQPNGYVNSVSGRLKEFISNELRYSQQQFRNEIQNMINRMSGSNIPNQVIPQQPRIYYREVR